MTVVKLDREKVRKILLDRGYSWSTFATKAKVNPNSLRDALTADVGVLPKTAKKIADALGMKASDIADYA